MSYSSLHGCVAKGSYFSVHHKFSIFEIKYVKKGKKCFLCLTVYYPPLFYNSMVILRIILCIMNHVTDRNISHLMNIFHVYIFVKECTRDEMT